MKTVRLGITTRPWGSFYSLEKKHGYQVKQLLIKPESRTSLQYHDHRDEIWIVVKGHGLAWHVGVDGKSIVQENIGIGDSLKVQCGYPHRIENTSQDSDLVVIEVQLGEPIEEEDIVRIADDYGRVG